MSDRELRDRLEALEVEVKRLTAEADALKALLVVPVQKSAPFSDVRIFEWFGSLSEPLATTIIVLAATVPILLAGLGLRGEHQVEALMVFVLAWPIITFTLMTGGYSTARTLHRLRGSLKKR